MSSTNRGRTLFDMLTGRNKRDLTPLELQYHNPLSAKVGNSVAFLYDPSLKDINFFVEQLAVYETKIGSKKYPHTDYLVKGVSLDMEKPLRFRLRLVPDSDANNDLGCKIIVLNVVAEFGWDEGFYNDVCLDKKQEFFVKNDQLGKPLDPPHQYWRVTDGLFDPYAARLTVLTDTDGNGKIDDTELERSNVRYWDYHRETEDDQNNKYVELFFVEMDENSKFFTLLRGREVNANEIMVF